MLKTFYSKIKIVALALAIGALFSQSLFTPLAKAQEDKGPLSKITFIHYKNGKAAVSSTIKGRTSGSCYSYIAGGAKWKAPKDYIVNPTNSSLDNVFVKQSIDLGVSEWEKYGSSNIFDLSSINSALPIGANNDQTNVASFGPWSDNNVIAVTTIWGYFSGPVRTREITEWDILFNTYYPWGDATTLGNTVMDLQDIATHELGHAAGMGDVYSGACFAETMYGYSSLGETSDQTLNTGDIQGISKLYR